LWCIGVDTDQWETVPEAHPCLITSAVKLIMPGVVEIIGEASQGLFVPGNRFGRVGLADFHDHESAVTDEMRIDLDRIESGLTSGAIETGYSP
jgi:basic membrane protein A